MSRVPGSRDTDGAPDGIFVLDKPAGWASTRCVSLVRRLTGIRRVGHAGTLDPFATGVLPVCVGRATRVVEALHDSTKAYHATLRLGIETDTGDIEGAVVARGDARAVTGGAIAEALAAFTGEIQQVPPAHSALKVQGVPAYRLARQGEAPVLAPRRAEIKALHAKRFDGQELELDVVCGRGVYIRALARDLGRALGCGAHLAALRRTRVGHLDRPVTPEALEQAFVDGGWRELLLPLDVAFAGWPCAILGPERAELVAHGRTIRMPGARRPGGQCVAYSLEGRALALLDPVPGDSWHPSVVFVAGGDEKNA